MRNSSSKRRVAGLAALGLIALTSGCIELGPTPQVNFSGGTPVSNCDEACQAQLTADQQAAAAARADAAAQQARDAQLTQMRSDAVRALDNAIADFIHRRPASTPFDAGSPVREMLHELQNLRSIMAGAPLSEVNSRYASTEELLNRAYDLALSIGMFDPRTIGQRSASETWWYISS